METQTHQTSTTPTATRSTWAIDPAHSHVQFAVRHLVVSTVKGRFGDVSGTITLDEQHLARSSIDVEIDAATVDTREERRDAHLRSADFLGVERFPTITFRSTRVEPGRGDAFRVVGDLTIRGVTRRVVLDNTSLAVRRILKGRDREETDAFHGFRGSYPFHADFCAPSRGNEKGSAEGGVRYARGLFFRPRPDWIDLVAAWALKP